MVTICTAQWSLYVPPLVTICTASGHYMYHQFNIQQFYVLPTHCIYVFCVDLRTNSHYAVRTRYLYVIPVNFISPPQNAILSCFLFPKPQLTETPSRHNDTHSFSLPHVPLLQYTLHLFTAVFIHILCSVLE